MKVHLAIGKRTQRKPGGNLIGNARSMIHHSKAREPMQTREAGKSPEERQ